MDSKSTKRIVKEYLEYKEKIESKISNCKDAKKIKALEDKLKKKGKQMWVSREEHYDMIDSLVMASAFNEANF